MYMCALGHTLLFKISLKIPLLGHHNDRVRQILCLDTRDKLKILPGKCSVS